MVREKASEQSERIIRVLSASDDLGLSRSRVLLLQQFGYEAMYSVSQQHARDLIETTGIDVLIFGSALARDRCWELAEMFRNLNSEGTGATAVYTRSRHLLPLQVVKCG
jgi:hypothetical protein